MSRFISELAIPAMARLVPTHWVQRRFSHFVPVFLMHRFSCPDSSIKGHNLKILRKNLEYFRKHKYHAISLNELGESVLQRTPVPYKSAVFTIDDGFLDQYEVAAPLFAEYDIPLTFFLVTDLLDGKLWPWDDQLHYIFFDAEPGVYEVSAGGQTLTIGLFDAATREDALNKVREIIKSNDNTHLYRDVDSIREACNVDMPASPPQNYRPMSWAQAQSLVEMGHDVAAHTCTHRILSQLNAEESAYEINQSIHRVKEKVSGSANVFAYPTGRPSDFTDREIACLEKAGIAVSVSTVATEFVINDECGAEERQNIPRFGMPDSQVDFIQYLTWIEFLKNRVRSL